MAKETAWTWGRSETIYWEDSGNKYAEDDGLESLSGDDPPCDANERSDRSEVDAPVKKRVRLVARKDKGARHGICAGNYANWF